MESIYYVATFLCHRTCQHCYEDRFRPYHGADLQRVVGESVRNHSRIIENFPDRMTFLDLNDCDPVTGQPKEKIGRVIISGGEVLLKEIRTQVLYPALDLLWQKYDGNVKLIVQTTGDTLTESIVDELLSHHVWHISISGIDAYHQGMETPAAQQQHTEKLTRMFTARDMRPYATAVETGAATDLAQAYFSFFGATEDEWIGPLWPRGRAWENELSKAGLADNFCNRWSGALNFLQYQYSGSEVSVDPQGNVFPCCIKTKAPIGNLLQDKLETILNRLIGNPVYEALSMGHPERMGIAHGWSVEQFLAASKVTLPSGKGYQNLCIGCDRFHEQVLMPKHQLIQMEQRVE